MDVVHGAHRKGLLHYYEMICWRTGFEGDAPWPAPIIWTASLDTRLCLADRPRADFPCLQLAMGLEHCWRCLGSMMSSRMLPFCNGISGLDCFGMGMARAVSLRLRFQVPPSLGTLDRGTEISFEPYALTVRFIVNEA